MANGNGGGERELLDRVYKGVLNLQRSREASPMQIMEYIYRNTGETYLAPPINGEAYTQQDIMATMRRVNDRAAKLESGPDVVGGAALSALHGASFGGLDEAIGLVGGDKEEYRRQLESFRQQHRGIALASEIAGGFLAPGLAMVQGLRGGASTLGALGRGALVGGVEGAAVGALEAEGGAAERGIGGAIGGAIGGVAGAVLGAGGHGARKLWQAFRGRGGRETAEAARDIAQDVAASGPRGPQGVIDEFERMRAISPEATLADVPEMTDLLVKAGGESPEAQRVIQEVVPPRMERARQRVEQSLVENMGLEAPPSAVQRAQAMRSRIAAGSEAFNNLAEEVQAVSSEPLMKILNDVPAVQQAFFKAARLAGSVGQPLRKILQKGEEGAISLTGMLPDFSTLQAIKLNLDDTVSALYRKGRANAARTVAAARDQFYGAFKDAVSEYGGVQQRWFQLMSEEEAVTAGSQFFKQSGEEIADNLQRFAGRSPEAAIAFRESAVETISQRLRNTRRGTDVTNLFDTDAMNHKLTALFPDEEGFSRFLDVLDVERAFYRTGQALSGESVKAPRISTALGGLGEARQLLQRVAITPAAPAVGVGRLTADVAQRRLAAQSARRAPVVGGLLGESLLRGQQRSGLSASNLLRGSRGDLMLPGAASYLAFRSPAALLMAMSEEGK